MRLLIATPEAILLDRDDILSLRAEDEIGSFGILPGHVPFLTVLTPSVVSWRQVDGREGHCAARGGVLSVHGHTEITLATREAVLGDEIGKLETACTIAWQPQRRGNSRSAWPRRMSRPSARRPRSSSATW
jgi:F-type H+-transporting ATPase subunit epsilon